MKLSKIHAVLAAAVTAVTLALTPVLIAPAAADPAQEAPRDNMSADCKRDYNTIEESLDHITYSYSITCLKEHKKLLVYLSGVDYNHTEYKDVDEAEDTNPKAPSPSPRASRT